MQRVIELRFIEQMPLDAERGWTEHGMITAPQIHALLSADFVLERDRRQRDGAPAERFEVRRRHVTTGEASGTVLGTVGIIASVSEPFCSDCRRTRITAEGKIMSCLFSREEFDLLALLGLVRRTTNWCTFGRMPCGRNRERTAWTTLVSELKTLCSLTAA